MKDYISLLSPCIFWDVKIDKLEVDRDKKFIIERIIDYGTEEDEIIMYKMYEYDVIKDVILNLDYMNKNSLNYLSVIFNIDKEKFKCYGKKQPHRI